MNSDPPVFAILLMVAGLAPLMWLVAGVIVWALPYLLALVGAVAAFLLFAAWVTQVE